MNNCYKIFNSFIFQRKTFEENGAQAQPNQTEEK
jgi:hypothetical protein